MKTNEEIWEDCIITLCPKCRSDNAEIGELYYDSENIPYMKIECIDCGNVNYQEV